MYCLFHINGLLPYDPSITRYVFVYLLLWIFEILAVDPYVTTRWIISALNYLSEIGRRKNSTWPISNFIFGFKMVFFLKVRKDYLDLFAFFEGTIF